MQVQVNGEAREIDDGASLEQLLTRLEVKRERVAVEVNAEVVRRAQHASTILKPGDQVEIVTFVGGG